jgi:hypothetical protein
MPSPSYGQGLNSKGHRVPRPFLDYRSQKGHDDANGFPHGFAQGGLGGGAMGNNSRGYSFPEVNSGLPGGGYRTSNAKNPNSNPNHQQQQMQGGLNINNNNNGIPNGHNNIINNNNGVSNGHNANGAGLVLSAIEEPLNNPRFNQLCHFFNTAQGCKYGNDCGYMHKVIKKNLTVCHFYGSAKGCQAPSCGFVHNMAFYQ